jgi:thiol-disulfide isomerase/thioredoxin
VRKPGNDVEMGATGQGQRTPLSLKMILWLCAAAATIRPLVPPRIWCSDVEHWMSTARYAARSGLLSAAWWMVAISTAHADPRSLGSAPEAAVQAAAQGDVVLLDFAASWCGPCRQMAPIIGEITAAGWVVRHVDADHEPDLIRRFAVTGVPCYVLLVRGEEVGRINGATTHAELERLLAKSRQPLGLAAAPIAAAAPAGPTLPRVPGIPLPAAAATAPLALEPPAAPRKIPGAVIRGPAPIPLAEPAIAHDPTRLAAATPPGALPDRSQALSPETRATLERRLLQATARLRVDDAQGMSWGTGTVIDCRQGEALILTCGHIFRDSDGKGRVEVDLFGQQGTRGVAGQVVGYDLTRDLALVSVFTDQPIEAVRVGGPDCDTAAGDAVVTVGCNGGDDPTLHYSQINGVDKYLGPANVQVAGQPVQGRSGGGLFTLDGTLIGVCNAADPADNEGLYAALPAIHEQLDEAGLAFVYRSVYPSGGLPVGTTDPTGIVPAMPDEMPQVAFDRRDRAGAVPTASNGADHEPSGKAASGVAATPLSSGEKALLDHVRRHEGKAEVICIVRPHGAPQAASEVFVLQNASHGFVEHLSRTHLGDARQVVQDMATNPPAATSR